MSASEVLFRVRLPWASTTTSLGLGVLRQPSNRQNTEQNSWSARVSQLGSLLSLGPLPLVSTSRGQRAEAGGALLWRGCRLPRPCCLPVAYGGWNEAGEWRLPEPRISRRFAHADRRDRDRGSPWGFALPWTRGADVHVICFWPSRSESINQRRPGPNRFGKETVVRAELASIETWNACQMGWHRLSVSARWGSRIRDWDWAVVT